MSQMKTNLHDPIVLRGADKKDGPALLSLDARFVSVRCFILLFTQRDAELFESEKAEKRKWSGKLLLAISGDLYG